MHPSWSARHPRRHWQHQRNKALPIPGLCPPCRRNTARRPGQRCPRTRRLRQNQPWQDAADLIHLIGRFSLPFCWPVLIDFSLQFYNLRKLISFAIDKLSIFILSVYSFSASLQVLVGSLSCEQFWLLSRATKLVEVSTLRHIIDVLWVSFFVNTKR